MLLISLKKCAQRTCHRALRGMSGKGQKTDALDVNGDGLKVR
jgi:hypothetical protein